MPGPRSGPAVRAGATGDGRRRPGRGRQRPRPRCRRRGGPARRPGEVATTAARANQSGASSGSPSLSSVAAKKPELACPLGKLLVDGRRTGRRGSPARRGARPLEQPLDALVDDERLHAQQHGQPQGTVGAPVRGQPPRRADELPDHRPVAERRRGPEDAIADRVAPELLQRGVERGVEARHGGGGRHALSRGSGVIGGGRGTARAWRPAGAGRVRGRSAPAPRGRPGRGRPRRPGTSPGTRRAGTAGRAGA